MSTYILFLQKRAGSEMHLPNLRPENDLDAPPAPEYCIDANSIGNFARFINHSCQPNLFVQCILSSHNDVKLAKVTLFAADTILPLQVRWVLLFFNKNIKPIKKRCFDDHVLFRSYPMTMVIAWTVLLGRMEKLWSWPATVVLLIAGNASTRPACVSFWILVETNYIVGMQS